MNDKLDYPISVQEIIDGRVEGLRVINNGLERLHKDVEYPLRRQTIMETYVLYNPDN